MGRYRLTGSRNANPQMNGEEMVDKKAAKTEEKHVTESAPKTAKAAKKTGVRDIGIDVTHIPTQVCQDDKCPYHGHLKIRGRVFTGQVKSDKMKNGVVVEWDYLQAMPKFQRFMRKKSRVVAHRPDCITAHIGDNVRIAECRPLSKTKKFVVIEALPVKA